MMRPPGAVACSSQSAIPAHHGGDTHIDRSLQASLNTSAFICRRDLTQGLAVERCRLDSLGNLLRKLQLRFDCVRPLHGNNDGSIGKPIFDGELDSVLLDVGNDHLGLADRLAEGGTEKADSPGTEHQDR
jgi:hypothetical protein